MLARILRIYVDQLLKGNPIAVIFTIIWVVAVSVGPFYEGVSRRDPVAIGLMGLVGFLCFVFLVIVIIDKRSNAKKNPSKKKPAESSSRGGRR
jgi:threonine/homoserine/homoserine lactone efflux protein